MSPDDLPGAEISRRMLAKGPPGAESGVPLLGQPETNGHEPVTPGDGGSSYSIGLEPHRGQLRFAQRFAGEYGGQMLHAHGIGWHSYRSRWMPCVDGAEVRAVTQLLSEALMELPVLEKDERDALYKDVRRVESAAGITGVLTIAGNLKPISVSAARLDGDPFALNTPSGTVDLNEGTVRPARPYDYITKITGGRFDPDARSEVFDEFLSTVQPDGEMRAFLARALGSAMLGLVRDHVMFIWYGSGANGKSTLRDTVGYALGDYVVNVPSDLLLQSKYGHAAQAPDRMRLKGARLAFCSEIAKGARLDEATMKDLTGNDQINAKALYKNPIEFAPSHTLVMLTNHLPQVRGDDPATWRRLMAVPFSEVVPANERDLRLPEKLREAADAVLAWLWHGWLDYKANGLRAPAAVRGATREYQLDSDIVARFLADSDVVMVRDGVRTLSAELYEAFTDWARSQGERHDLTQKAFSGSLGVRGFTKKTTNRGAEWDRVALVSRQPEPPI